MTTPVQPNRVTQECDGIQTAFTFSFKYFNNIDINVFLIGLDGSVTPQTEGVHYSLSSVDKNIGGTVTFSVPPTSDKKVFIIRKIIISQTNPFKPNMNFPEQIIEAALDKLTMLVQQLAEVDQRCLKLPVQSDLLELSTPVPEAGRALLWNAEETGLENSTVNLNDFQSYIDAVEAAAGLAQAAVGAVPVPEAGKVLGQNSDATQMMYYSPAEIAALAPIGMESRYSILSCQQDANGFADLLYIQGSGDVEVGLPIYSTAAEAAAGIDGVSVSTQRFALIYGRANDNVVTAGMGGGGSEYDIIDLGTPRVLKRFNYKGSGSIACRMNQVEASVDGVTYVTLWGPLNGIYSIEQTITDTTAYRYVRVHYYNANASSTCYAGAFNVVYLKTVSAADSVYFKSGGTSKNLAVVNGEGTINTFQTMPPKSIPATPISTTWNLFINSVGVIEAFNTTVKYSRVAPTSPSTNAVWVDLVSGIQYKYSGSAWVYYSAVYVGSAVTNSSGAVTSVVQPKIRNRNYLYSKSTVGLQALPSASYVDVSLPASGSDITATANGYLCVDRTASAAGQYIKLVNNASGARSGGGYVPSGVSCIAMVPVQIGETVTCTYTAAGATNLCRILKTIGET